ncbi:MAG: hypothetical protein RIG82_09340 [Phycisphaeraceae bacterium]
MTPRNPTTLQRAPGASPGCSRWTLLVLTPFLLAALLTACAEPVRTTRTDTEDFSRMSSAIAQDLLAAPAIAERRPDSQPWVIVADRIENLSSEVLSPLERKATIRRILSGAPLKQLADNKNITFIVPMDDVQNARNTGIPELQQLAANRQPTHRLAATFRSATRAQAKQRTDAYDCAFELLDLQTGQLLWTGSIEFKRAAVGHIWD